MSHKTFLSYLSHLSERVSEINTTYQIISYVEIVIQ